MISWIMWNWTPDRRCSVPFLDQIQLILLNRVSLLEQLKKNSSTLEGVTSVISRQFSFYAPLLTDFDQSYNDEPVKGAILHVERWASAKRVLLNVYKFKLLPISIHTNSLSSSPVWRSSPTALWPNSRSPSPAGSSLALEPPMPPEQSFFYYS